MMNDKKELRTDLTNLEQEIPGDPPVYYAQVWLNDTYGNVPGWVALQKMDLPGREP